MNAAHIGVENRKGSQQHHSVVQRQTETQQQQQQQNDLNPVTIEAAYVLAYESERHRKACALISFWKKICFVRYK